MREGRILRLEGVLDRTDGGLRRIQFENGSSLAHDGLLHALSQRRGSELVQILGCEIVAIGPVRRL